MEQSLIKLKVAPNNYCCKVKLRADIGYYCTYIDANRYLRETHQLYKLSHFQLDKVGNDHVRVEKERRRLWHWNQSFAIVNI